MARLSGCSRCQQFLNNIKFQQKQPVVALYQPMLGKYKTKSKKTTKQIKQIQPKTRWLLLFTKRKKIPSLCLFWFCFKIYAIVGSKSQN